jgi:DNA-binding transcriptional LysR family regulator
MTIRYILIRIPMGRVFDVELAHLDTFLAVYRARNLTAAAKALHLSQPAVTGHLKALEAELASPLFVRLARGVAPTPIAHRLADDIATPLDALHESVSSFLPGAPVATATCLIGGPSDALSHLVLPALAPLVATGLHVRFRTGLTAPLLEALSDGELDLVVATTPVRRRNVVSEPLFVETMRLVTGRDVAASLDLRLLRRNPLQALRNVPLVAYDDTAPLARRYFRDQFPGTTPPEPHVTLPDLRGIAAVLRSGTGWSVLPDYLIDSDADDLAVVHKPTSPTTNTLHLATRASRRHHRAVAAVHDRLVGALANLKQPNR